MKKNGFQTLVRRFEGIICFKQPGDAVVSECDRFPTQLDHTSTSGSSSFGFSKPLNFQGVKVETVAGGSVLEFVAQGQGIVATRVEIFDLLGRQLFWQEMPGERLRWQPTNWDGQALANGVYFYRVSVQGADGKIVHNRLQKLVVQR